MSLASPPPPSPAFPEDLLKHRPLILDIGCHRGTFLTAMAAANPSGFFLGIEKLGDRAARANAKLARLGLANALVLRGRAEELLRAMPDRAVAGIHILFPDPWPKRRHAGRRLICVPFLLETARLLEPGGFLRIVTDDTHYAAEIADLLEGSEYFVSAVSPEFPPTRFEERFAEEGKSVHRFYRVRTAESSAR